MLVNIVIVIVCVAALWGGATLLVEAASRIAARLGVSELIIGLTVVAFGTSAPEFAVTTAAAFGGNSDISVANIVGSNIFNLGFILGGVAIVRAIKTSPKIVYRDGGVLIAATLLLLFFLRDLELQRYEGAIMFGSLVLYIIYLISQREASDEELPEGDFNWTDIPRLLIGLVLIVAGGHFLVEAATEIALALGVSQWVIGVTIVAAGTSAPEMATSMVAVLRGRYGLSIGNLIGSDLFNLLGVLGLAGMIQTVAAPMVIPEAGYTSIMLLVALVVLVVIMLRTGWRLSRWEGALLVAINLVRWTLDFMGNSPV